MDVTETAVRDEARWAAAWWISRLGQLHDPFGLDSGRMVSVAAMEVALDLNVRTVRGGRFDADERDRFQVELEQLIGALMADCPGQRMTVLVDWAPDKVLCLAAERAGLDLAWTDLPVKTSMVIKPGEAILVKQGYGGRWETIWPRPAEGMGNG